MRQITHKKPDFMVPLITYCTTHPLFTFIVTSLAFCTFIVIFTGFNNATDDFILTPIPMHVKKIFMIGISEKLIKVSPL